MFIREGIFLNRKILSAVVALITASTATGVSAAANPFADVPRDHWAYDAVTQLAADGVIEGYGDGTFRGERNITRYEMAQMVAKAMAKNPTGTDKAIIDRLAAEFGDELNNLGVRVANLERNADMLKWNGELRYAYWSNRDEAADGSKAKSNTNRLELRLFPTAEVNDHWKIKGRLTARTNLKTDASGDLTMTYLYAEGKYKNFTVGLGKMSNYSTNDDGLVTDDYFSGAQLVFGKKLQAVLEAGRWNMARANADIAGSFGADGAANYQGIQLNYNGGKTFAGLGYRHFTSDDFYGLKNYSNGNNEDSADIFSIGASQKIGSSVTLAAAFAKNTKADNFDTSHSIKLGYKGAQRNNAGTWGAYVAYRYISPFVSFAPTYETMGFRNNRKGIELGLQYVPMTRMLADVQYFDGKQLDTSRDVKTLFGRVRWYF